MDPFATFREFMKEANTPGRIDARNKKLIAVALSIASHCNPCLKTHLHEAIEMHIPKEELDEVAKLATEFGGCPAMMFYRQVCQELGLH